MRHIHIYIQLKGTKLFMLLRPTGDENRIHFFFDFAFCFIFNPKYAISMNCLGCLNKSNRQQKYIKEGTETNRAKSNKKNKFTVPTMPGPHRSVCTYETCYVTGVNMKTHVP